MIEPGVGGLRIARGVALAALCTGLAAAGHLLGGGHLPPTPALFGTGALLGAAFVIAAGRDRAFGQLAMAACGSQLLFHLAFGLTGHGGFAMDGSMVLGHALAALPLAGLAAYGETLVWALAGLLRWFAVPSLAVVPITTVRPFVPIRTGLPVVRAARDARIQPRRGPPAI